MHLSLSSLADTVYQLWHLPPLAWLGEGTLCRVQTSLLCPCSIGRGCCRRPSRSSAEFSHQRRPFHLDWLAELGRKHGCSLETGIYNFWGHMTFFLYIDNHMCVCKKHIWLLLVVVRKHCEDTFQVLNQKVFAVQYFVAVIKISVTLR